VDRPGPSRAAKARQERPHRCAFPAGAVSPVSTLSVHSRRASVMAAHGVGAHRRPAREDPTREQPPGLLPSAAKTCSGLCTGPLHRQAHSLAHSPRCGSAAGDGVMAPVGAVLAWEGAGVVLPTTVSRCTTMTGHGLCRTSVRLVAPSIARAGAL
jgi:hypothetical protein